MNQTTKAFTLIEVIIAIALLGLVISFIIPAFVSSLQINNSSEQRSYAITAAQQVLERLRLTDPSGLPSSGNGTAVNITIGGQTYVVTPSYCGIASYCATSSRYIKLSISLNSRIIYTVETIFTKVRPNS